MGCNSSSPDILDEDENDFLKKEVMKDSNGDTPNVNSQDEDDKTLESLCVAWMEEFGTIKFPALIGGKRLWYLDEFKPKGSKEKIKMWKEAVVDFVDTAHDCVHLKLSPKNKIRERTVDLNRDWNRLALPALNLSKEQRILGQPLSDEQWQKSYALLTAETGYEEERNSRLSVSNIEEEEESNGGFDDHDLFSVGKEVDVQDVFLAKGRKEIKTKWRKAKIIDVPSSTTIRVHYIGWDDRWDETIDFNRDPDRIKPGGTMTALFKAKSMKPAASFANKSDSNINRTRIEKSMSLNVGSSSPRELSRSKSQSNASDSGAFADTAFRTRMKRAGMNIVQVEGDGNCLFRAVAHQMFLDESRHMEIRSECVDHMRRHRERFETFCTTKFDDHLNRMSLSGTWGDDLEIRALEEIIDRPFFIYSADNTKDLTPVPLNTAYKDGDNNFGDDIIPLKLSYHGRSHYNSVVDQNISLPLELKSTSLILESRMKIYEAEKRKKMLNPQALTNLGVEKKLSTLDFSDDEEEWTRSTEFSQ